MSFRGLPTAGDEMEQLLRDMILRIEQLERRPDGYAPLSGDGVTNHGALVGLDDDDHPQYHNDTRGDARYSLLGHSHTAYVPYSLVDAKGDLLGGTGDDTMARLPVGTDDYVLTADAAEATGMKWAPASVGSSVLDDLSDVVITSVGDNDILGYDSGSGDWINQDASELGLATATHDHDADYEPLGAVSTHEGAADPHTGYQLESEKGANNGYAGLDGSGLVLFSDLPTGTTSSTVAIGNHTHGDADLPSEIAYEDEANTFTQLQTFDGSLVYEQAGLQYYQGSGVLRDYHIVAQAVGFTPSGALVIKMNETPAANQPFRMRVEIQQGGNAKTTLEIWGTWKSGATPSADGWISEGSLAPSQVQIGHVTASTYDGILVIGDPAGTEFDNVPTVLVKMNTGQIFGSDAGATAWQGVTCAFETSVSAYTLATVTARPTQPVGIDLQSTDGTDGYTLDGLKTPSSAYQAVNKEYVDGVSAVSDDGGNPDQVTGVTLHPATVSLGVEWTEVTNTDMGFGSGLYRVQVDDTSSAFASIIREETVTGSFMSFSNLTPATTYWVRVRAEDPFGGVGTWSTTASTSTGQFGTTTIADDAIQTSKIDADQIVTAHILAGNVTAVKLETTLELEVGQVIESGSFSSTTGWQIRQTGDADFHGTLNFDTAQISGDAYISGTIQVGAGTPTSPPATGIHSANYDGSGFTDGFAINNSGDAWFAGDLRVYNDTYLYDNVVVGDAADNWLSSGDFAGTTDGWRLLGDGTSTFNGPMTINSDATIAGDLSVTSGSVEGNYGTSGWKLFADGTADFNNSVDVGGTMTLGGSGYFRTASSGQRAELHATALRWYTGNASEDASGYGYLQTGVGGTGTQEYPYLFVRSPRLGASLDTAGLYLFGENEDSTSTAAAKLIANDAALVVGNGTISASAGRFIEHHQGAVLYKSGEATSTGTWDDPTFTTTDLVGGDEYGFFDDTNDRFEIPSTFGNGQLYLFWAHCAWAADTTGSRLLEISKNGTNVKGAHGATGAYSYEFSLGVCFAMNADAGDYYAMRTWQNSGGNKSTNLRFGIYYLGQEETGTAPGAGTSGS